MTRCLLSTCIALTLVLLSASADAQKSVYKWTDAQGVTHYGDAVPPQYADQEKTLLNAQGIAVGSIPGKRSAAETEADTARHQKEEAARLSRQHDQTLLATYLSVTEIEALRDRRADILEAQARITQQFIEQLRVRERQLEQQLRGFRPYNASATAPQPPQALLETLTRTLDDMASQQHALDTKHAELDTLRAQFANDIARFKELKRQP